VKRLSVAAAALGLFVLVGAIWWKCAPRDAEVARDDRVIICNEVITAAQCICDCLGGITNGLNVVKIDARKLDCNRLFKVLSDVPSHAMIWMPGEFDWLVTWPAHDQRVSVAEMLDRYASLDGLDALVKAGCDSVPAVFASYVGLVRDVLPAFSAIDPNEMVVPELFVTKALPELDEFVLDDLDEDVRRRFLDDVRARQAVRRTILDGCIRSRKGESEAAVEAWARAARCFANDTMLVERLEHLKTNGEVFFKLGKPGMAARCYEIMAQIRPNDPVPVFNFGVCAQKLGKQELAEKAFERAKKLGNRGGSGEKGR